MDPTHLLLKMLNSFLPLQMLQTMCPLPQRLKLFLRNKNLRNLFLNYNKGQLQLYLVTSIEQILVSVEGL